jgi:flagellar basal-body rod protein FlgG
LDPGINDVLLGCQIQVHRLETIANNLANADTAGFKKDVLSFDHLLTTHQEANLDQGNIRHTDNALDLALSGKGFFKVNTPDGIRYTRNGKFYLNAEGQLTTTAGDSVLGEGGPITIEGTDVAVDDSGRISVDGSEVDTLDTYCLYTGDDGEGPRPQETSVKQGYIEQSNVIVTQEMIEMIETLREFESYQKVLQTFDETDAKVINDVGKL